MITFVLRVLSCQRLLELLVEELSKVLEKLDGWNLKIPIKEVHLLFFVLEVCKILGIGLDFLREDFKEMLHEVHDANCRYLVTGHLDKVEAKFVLFWVDIASLDKDFLLLGNGRLQDLHPVDDVPVTRGQLVCSSYLNQFIQGLLILVVGQLKR